MLRKKKISDIDLMSRQAILWMHPTALLPLMTSQRWVVNEGHLPEDVQFHSVFWDANRQVWGVICLSETFKQAIVGQPLPELEPVAFRYWNPSKDGAIE